MYKHTLQRCPRMLRCREIFSLFTVHPGLANRLWGEGEVLPHHHHRTIRWRESQIVFSRLWH